jgi:hypothetical protein
MTDLFQTQLPDAPPPRQLTGWKEIATHLGRGVRTVQRWEHEFGLPVRRMGRDQTESVFAFVREVDEWLTSTSAARARRGQHLDGRRDDPPFYASSPSAAGDSGSGVQPPSAFVDEDVAHVGAGAPLPAPGARLRPATRGWLCGLVATIGVLGLTFGIWRATGAPREPAPTILSGGPGSWRVDVDTLVVLDAAGGALWSHRFAFPLDAASYAAPSTSNRLGGILDLDADGHREVWFVTRTLAQSDRSRRRLHVFNADGSMRWVFGYDGSVTFGTRTYTAWNLDYVFQIPDPGTPARSALWAVSKERTEFPSVLHRLDVATGAPMSEYWSDGYIEEVVGGTWQGKPALFVGACNNDMQASSLAVLDQASANGFAPAARSAYRCTSCGPGSPLAFLVLPKPRRFSALSPAGCVEKIEIDDRGGLTVMASHASAPGGLAARGIYRFDERLNLTNVSAGDNYSAAFQALVRAGAVAPFSPVDVSPEREFAPILRWTGRAFAPAELRLAVARSASR